MVLVVFFILSPMAGRNPIVDVIENQLLPQFETVEPDQLIVVRPDLQQMRQFAGLSLTSKKRQGPRTTFRSFTFNGTTAYWPNDELIETRAPILHFVLEGMAELKCCDYIMRVPQQRAVFTPAGISRWTGVRMGEFLGQNPNRFSNSILFHERCGSLEIWLNHDRGNQHYRSKPNEIMVMLNKRLIHLLEEIQNEVVEPRSESIPIACRLLEIFLLTLKRDLREEKAIFPGRLDTHSQPAIQAYDPIQEAQQYIRDHLHEPLTQEKVARQVRLARTQFIRRFREETGQTFNQFVTLCRMQQAQVLLENTDFPLTKIYEFLGYRSFAHFNKTFRNHTGMLPSAYRLKIKTDSVGA